MEMIMAAAGIFGLLLAVRYVGEEVFGHGVAADVVTSAGGAGGVLLYLACMAGL